MRSLLESLNLGATLLLEFLELALASDPRVFVLVLALASDTLRLDDVVVDVALDAFIHLSHFNDRLSLTLAFSLLTIGFFIAKALLLRLVHFVSLHVCCLQLIEFDVLLFFLCLLDSRFLYNFTCDFLAYDSVNSLIIIVKSLHLSLEKLLLHPPLFLLSHQWHIAVAHFRELLFPSLALMLRRLYFLVVS